MNKGIFGNAKPPASTATPAIGTTAGRIVVTGSGGVVEAATIGSGLTLSGGTLAARITISNASPTGGSDGDIWLKY